MLFKISFSIFSFGISLFASSASYATETTEEGFFFESDKSIVVSDELITEKKRPTGMRYFHGHYESAELSLRGWALIYNFAPSCPETRKRHGGMSCPSERIKGFRYRENWLENLLVSASLQGKRRPPQNPLQ